MMSGSTAVSGIREGIWDCLLRFLSLRCCYLAPGSPCTSCGGSPSLHSSSGSLASSSTARSGAGTAGSQPQIVQQFSFSKGRLGGAPSASASHERRTRMPQEAWSQKRDRQYEHIKEGLLERGRDEDTAEEIAARTVNKERARAGEASTASRTSTDDLSSGRRGGLRSHRGSGGRTYEQLYNEARQRGVKGRSRMNKQELERALSR